MCYATFMFQFHKLIFKVEYVVEENMKFFFLHLMDLGMK